MLKAVKSTEKNTHHESPYVLNEFVRASKSSRLSSFTGIGEASDGVALNGNCKLDGSGVDATE